MIQLYRAGHPAFKLDSRNPLNLRWVTKAQLERKAMEQDAVAITLISVTPCEFYYRDYLIVDGRPYFLNVVPKKAKEDKRKFTTDLTFEGGMYELGRVFFTMTDLHGWDYSGRLYDFCNLVVNEMNRNSLVIKDSQNRVLRYSGRIIGGYYYWRNVVASDTESYFTTRLIPLVGDDVMPGEWVPGDQGYPLVTEVGGAWTLDFENDTGGKPVQTEEKFLTYDNHTCLAVMNDLVAQWEDWEYAIDVRSSDLCNLDLTSDIQCGGKIIMRRKATGIYISGVNTTHTNMAYGKKGGLAKITTESSDGQNMPTRIYFYGGSQNLPTTYRNTRVCLPGKKKEESYIDTGFTDNKPCEAVKIFDDIYPACKQFAVTGAGMSFADDKHFTVSMFGANFFDVFAQWADPNASPQPEYGSYDEWRLLYGTGNATTDLQRYLTYYYQGNTPGLGWSGTDNSADVIERCKEESLAYTPPPMQGVVSDEIEYDGFSIAYTSPEPIPSTAPSSAGQTATGTRTATIRIHMIEKIEYEGGQVDVTTYDDVYTNQVITYNYVAVTQAPSAGFPKNCYLLGDVKITFQTGDLAGHSFKITNFDNSLGPLWYAMELECEGVESAIPDTENPTYFPNIDIMCKYGDRFIVEGCLMPASYVYANFGSGNYAAETLLEEQAKRYIEELALKLKVGVEISQDFINQHNAVFRLYDKINITDIDVLPEHEKTYFAVRRVIYDMLKNSYKVEIDDGKGANPWTAISQYLERIRPIK